MLHYSIILNIETCLLILGISAKVSGTNTESTEDIGTMATDEGNPLTIATLEKLKELGEADGLPNFTPEIMGDLLAQHIAYATAKKANPSRTVKEKQIKIPNRSASGEGIIAAEVVTCHSRSTNLLNEEYIQSMVVTHKTVLLNKFSTDKVVTGLGIWFESKLYNEDDDIYDKYLVVAYTFERKTEERYLAAADKIEHPFKIDRANFRIQAVADSRASKLAYSGRKLPAVKHEISEFSGQVLFPLFDIGSQQAEEVVNRIIGFAAFATTLERIRQRVSIVYNALACIEVLKYNSKRKIVEPTGILAVVYSYTYINFAGAEFTSSMSKIHKNFGNISELGMRMAQIRADEVEEIPADTNKVVQIECTMVSKTFILSPIQGEYDPTNLQIVVSELTETIREAVGQTGLLQVVGSGYAIKSYQTSWHFVVVVIRCDNYFEAFFPIHQIYFSAEALVNISKHNNTGNFVRLKADAFGKFIINTRLNEVSHVAKFFSGEDKKVYEKAMDAIMNPDTSVAVAKFVIPSEDNLTQFVVLTSTGGDSYRIVKPTLLPPMLRQLVKTKSKGSMALLPRLSLKLSRKAAEEIAENSSTPS